MVVVEREGVKGSLAQRRWSDPARVGEAGIGPHWLAPGDQDSQHLAVKLCSDLDEIGVIAERYPSFKVTTSVIPFVSDEVENASALGGEGDTLSAEAGQTGKKPVLVAKGLDLEPAVCWSRSSAVQEELVRGRDAFRGLWLVLEDSWGLWRGERAWQGDGCRTSHGGWMVVWLLDHDRWLEIRLWPLFLVDGVCCVVVVVLGGCV